MSCPVDSGSLSSLHRPTEPAEGTQFGRLLSPGWTSPPPTPTPTNMTETELWVHVRSLNGTSFVAFLPGMSDNNGPIPIIRRYNHVEPTRIESSTIGGLTAQSNPSGKMAINPSSSDQNPQIDVARTHAVRPHPDSVPLSNPPSPPPPFPHVTPMQATGPPVQHPLRPAPPSDPEPAAQPGPASQGSAKRPEKY